MIRYFYLAGLALDLVTAFLIYDHLLTLDAEVKFVWSPKLRPGTCWFLAVRYIALSANIGVAVYYLSDLDHELRQDAMATLSLRVFAMYGLKKWVLWASVTYGQHANIPDVPGVVGCHAIYTANSLRSAGTWEALHSAYIIVVSENGHRQYEGFFLSPHFLTLTEFLSVGAVLGSMYFGMVVQQIIRIIVLANSANVFTFYLGDASSRGFTTSLSVTLLSRLMLNLHGAAATGTDTSTLNMETVRFTGAGEEDFDYR
ncbi:hypothetical protein B0H14DRAFT_2635795 [Mycena olivaceomarginata]|nr:hypothetical protein B0H14DRAFT_2635795 [Mycena olivaceomarginata]